mgnify:CR=1 FL=1
MVIGTKLHTEFLGLKKCILVHTEDAILILKKDKAQDVKDIYERLEKESIELIKTALKQHLQTTEISA